MADVAVECTWLVLDLDEDDGPFVLEQMRSDLLR